MSAQLPASIDVWRAVAGRRILAGTLPLARMSRLVAVLAEARGDARFELEFGRDELGIGFVDVAVRAQLPLVCQRSLETFDLPVEIESRLGLIGDERDEAGLPQRCEPLLVAEGELSPADVIEDELLLAVPLIPVKPGSDMDSKYNVEHAAPDPGGGTNNKPFAALAALKSNK